MRLSTHYYVISLSRGTAALYEAFRDNLIEVRNQGFPVNALAVPAPKAESTRKVYPADDANGAGLDGRLRTFLRIVDERLGHYYEMEPLMVVVAGEKELQAAFISETTHSEAIVEGVDGDFTATSLRDLGKVVWPVVREAMSGSRSRALRELEIAEDARKTCGLAAVSRRASEVAGATLLVEEDYHVRGSISEVDGSVTISPNVDVRDEIDDVVDMVIEKILESDGNVIFVPDGSLSGLERIVLLVGGADSARFVPVIEPPATS